MDNNVPQQPRPQTPPHPTNTVDCPGAPRSKSSKKKEINKKLSLDITAEVDEEKTK
jgi:hypothetical protein